MATGRRPEAGGGAPQGLIYAGEVQAARRSGQWNAVIAGATVFTADFVNETLNGR